ncbi:MAG: hypothetical protein LIO58_00985 [Oscillospiraceae bacterium]|nr:hypothetical protein [Oscillospiraceae bacterium]
MKGSVIMILLTAVCLSGCTGNDTANAMQGEEQDIVEIDDTGLIVQGEYYKIFKYSDTSYCHYIYNAEKQLAYRSYSYKIPSINLGAGDVLEIRYSAGHGTWSCEYFDIATSTVSSCYSGAVHITDQYIAYVVLKEDGSLKLQILDAFLPWQYDFEVELDFYHGAVYGSYLLGIDYIDQTHLNVTYLNTNAEDAQVVIEVPELEERSSSFMQGESDSLENN